ncbi:MAG: outer membrane beta-barrel protein [Bacteroidales bacterium]|nr:outer membrane beta-barrel protein [Bacteroidales bacterium]
MKKIKFSLMAALMLISTMASAQFSNSKSSGHSTANIFSGSSVDDYKRVQVSFVAAKMSFGGETADDATKGINAGILWGKGILDNVPLAVEYGANITWTRYSDEEEYWGTKTETKENFMNIAIPVNLAYHFSVNDDVSVIPHAGLNMRVNVLAKSTAEVDGEKEETNWFDDSDAKRFQLGANLGIGVTYQKYYLGYQFQADFMEFAEETKWRTNYITVGINF